MCECVNALVLFNGLFVGFFLHAVVTSSLRSGRSKAACPDCLSTLVISMQTSACGETA